MNADDRHVLVVDDDVAMRGLLTKWLQNAGYHVQAVRNGRLAMDMIQLQCPAILITDWEMPEIDGLELCRWLRSRALPRYVYTLLLTMRTGTSDIVRGLEAGADDFAKKPVDRHELLARLRSGSRVLDLESRLNELAKRDPLTGTFSQLALFERLEVEFHRSRRYGAPLSCVMLDIDLFKRINDTYGHQVGDRVIRGVAQLLQRQCRAADIVSRYGGEEFCVMLPETTEEGAVAWAGRIRQLIVDTGRQLASVDFDFTVSLGAAQVMEDTRSPERLVDMADQALLIAKRAGRNRVVGFRSISETVNYDASGTPSAVFRDVLARDIMTPLVAGLQQDDPITRAASFFLHLRIGSAPVVDEHGELVGVLTEKDLMEHLMVDSWGQTAIRQIMTTNVTSFPEETPAIVIYEFLCRVAIRSVVIVHDGTPVGVVSRGVILRWCTNRLAASENTTPPTAISVSSEDDVPSSSERETSLRTAEALSREALAVSAALADPTGDLVPRVIGGVSRIQELVNDLLSSAHFLPGSQQTLRGDDDADLLVGVDAFR